MAKKQSSTPKVKKLTMKEKMRTFEGNLLGDKYDPVYLEANGLHGRTLLRTARYYCFKIRSHTLGEGQYVEPPEGFKEFVESLPGFHGWEYFAVSWDLNGYNPFMTVLRLQSVWDDWDAVMRRVAIPINTPPEQLHERIQALTDNYARKQLKSK